MVFLLIPASNRLCASGLQCSSSILRFHKPHLGALLKKNGGWQVQTMALEIGPFSCRETEKFLKHLLLFQLLVQIKYKLYKT